MERPRILTLTEAEERFPVKRGTLLAAIKRGKLEGIRVGPIWTVSAAALGEWMAFGKHTPGPVPKPKPDRPKRRPGRPRKEDTASE